MVFVKQLSQRKMSSQKERFIPFSTSFSLTDIPARKGSYLLIFFLSKTTIFFKQTKRLIAEGWYCYCGSARGNGGLRSRLSRHMSVFKTVHWHIDLLTPQACFVAICLYERLTPFLECLLSQGLIHFYGFRAPLPGFGSTDCQKKCISHLLYTPNEMDWEKISTKIIEKI
ncbi:GIY-YIG nuclease family protein [Methylacidiphilum sp. Yel]|jgi:Uri superfamily endonuclease|uniref:GIY-YIG nuclease family protein n=1 Tax=Methylacidiphilum sp. Yel TaxID=1847730 RepID=UPI00106A6AA2|nr:GIY-YIG nuclease family protein [Methylacidiphilum sp. Yel]